MLLFLFICYFGFIYIEICRKLFLYFGFVDNISYVFLCFLNVNPLFTKLHVIISNLCFSSFLFYFPTQLILVCLYLI